MKIVETSLNLRVEKRLGKTADDYCLSKDIAEEQLKLAADIYCNVEYMECDDGKYMEAFANAGYIPYKGLDDNRRGIMYMIRQEYSVRVIRTMRVPHLFHIRVKKEGTGTAIDVVTVRILVSDSSDADYINRKAQWDRVLDYIDSISNKENICITGDFNHGVISEEYNSDQARRFYNYQMLIESLEKRNIQMAHIDGTSYRGYMKIDHFYASKKLKVLEAGYLDVFKNYHNLIGVPDHSLIVARVEW